MNRVIFASVLGLAVASAAGLSTMASAGPDVGGGTANWPNHNGSSDETSYSTLGQINKANVARLGLAWHADLPGEQMLESTPVAVDGIVYVTGSRSTVYAIDGATGKLLWTYDPEVWKHGPEKLHYIMPVNRGVAYDNGRIFVASIDGRLIALEAKTGTLVWSVDTTGPGSVQTITGAPRVFNGKVIIGQGGADFGARGYVTAYDQATGNLAWRFYMVPGTPEQNRGDAAMERAATTWKGAFWKTGTGGGPWDSITFDKELNRIYVGAGNAAPYDPEERSPGGGDNLYTASIVALDADTGKYVWHYQVNPRDSWDFDDTQQMALADLPIDGTRRKVLIQAPKNGFLYVIDRMTGKLISSGKIGKVTWADHIDLASGRPAEEQNIRYEHGEITIWPAPSGAHSWHTMSFSPQTGLVYIPYMQLAASFAKRSAENGMLGGLEISLVKRDPEDGKGALLAYDPVRQTPRWKISQTYFWNGGVMSTAGGLVFQGAADGFFSAYEAETGERLWRYDAGLGIIAAPCTYTIDGRQYVSVLVGYGGSNSLGDVMNAGWKYGAQPRRLLTFRLGGKSMLPPSAPPDLAVHPVDDPAVRIDEADVAPGKVLFARNCASCHGLDAISAGAPAPDLRESAVAIDLEALRGIMHDGPYLQRGMPRFEGLSSAQVRQIHAFIRAQARKVLDAGQAAASKAPGLAPSAPSASGRSGP